MENITRIGAWIRHLNRKIETSGNLLLKDSGITVMQLRVLRYLRLHPDQTQNINISSFFGIKHTSTIHVLNALEEKGLIYREKLPHGRAKKIILTDNGKILAQQNETLTDQMEEVMLKDFSENEKAQLFSFMKRIKDNLDKSYQ